MPVDAAMTAPADVRALREILPDAPAEFADLQVSGIAYDSRAVRRGDLFFALAGQLTDGALFARQAVEAGAVAIVAEQKIDLGIPVLVVANPRREMAEASLRFYGHPDRTVPLIGIVGTNGKSTVAAGLQTILECANVPAGLIGTVFYRWGGESKPAPRTTPESPDLVRMLAQMRDQGIRAAAVEVSSHAIALDRVWGLNFAGGVFTNLTRDHLDFHQTFENYRATKRLFFERLTSPRSFAAINADDPAGTEFADAVREARVIRYSANHAHADIRLAIVSHDLSGTRGRLVFNGSSWPFASPLWGAFNHSNLAAMAAAAHGFGLDGEAITRGLSEFAGIPGRCERVPSRAPFSVFVDYAHTPDALNAVLSAVRPLVRGRLLVLFGCGGDRDRGKRPEMAHQVERWADGIYLTSDNPRSEDPEAIIRDVQSGFSADIASSRVRIDPDRARAIERTMSGARVGDVVFLCGKGHETYQEVAGVMHQFSDRDVAARVLADKGYPPSGSPPGGDGR